MLPLKVPSSPEDISLKSIRSLPTELYDPKAFITHAASLRQAFAHCAIFPTAASRRSLDRVSVPVWLIILSDQLPIFALVRPLPHQLADGPQAHLSSDSLQAEATFDRRCRRHSWSYPVLAHLSTGYPNL